MARKQYSPKLKFQVVLEALTGEKTPAQIAKQYGIHPNSVGCGRSSSLSAVRSCSPRTPQSKPMRTKSTTLSSFWARKRSRSRF